MTLFLPPKALHPSLDFILERKSKNYPSQPMRNSFTEKAKIPLPFYHLPSALRPCFEWNAGQRIRSKIGTTTVGSADLINFVHDEHGQEVDNVSQLTSIHGSDCISFREVAGLTVANLSLENESSATLVIEKACVTSYKPKMWHGGVEELLRSVVGSTEDESLPVENLIGGISLSFSVGEEKGSCEWRLIEVKKNEAQWIEVMLAPNFSTDTEAEYQLSIFLMTDGIAAVLIASNNSTESKRVRLPSISSSLATTSGRATNLFGLQDVKYCCSEEEKTTNPKTNWSLIGRKAPQAEILETNLHTGPSILGDVKFAGRPLVTQTKSTTDLGSVLERLYIDSPSSISLVDRGTRRQVRLETVGLPYLVVKVEDEVHDAGNLVRLTSHPRNYSEEVAAGTAIRVAHVVRSTDFPHVQ